MARRAQQGEAQMNEVRNLQPHSSEGAGTLLATFRIRHAAFAIDAVRVDEVLRVTPITRVPHAPPEVQGIINLRGRIVSILDAGLQLGMAPCTVTPDSRIFVVADREEYLGLLVDEAGDVIEAAPEEFASAPGNVLPEQARYFDRVYHRADRKASAPYAQGALPATLHGRASRPGQANQNYREHPAAEQRSAVVTVLNLDKLLETVAG